MKMAPNGAVMQMAKTAYVRKDLPYFSYVALSTSFMLVVGELALARTTPPRAA